MAVTQVERPADRPLPAVPHRAGRLAAGLAAGLTARLVTALRRHRADLLAFASYLAGAFWVTSSLWLHPGLRTPSPNPGDEALFEWMFANTARSLVHFDNPLFSPLLNAPDGANLMVNTSVVALGVVMAPVTLAFGAPVSFLVALTLSLAATGTAWYYVLSRHLVSSRGAAWLGGAFCAFAPGMVAHANAHLNFTSQFLVPFIVWQVLRLRESDRVVRDGVVLGLLVTAQMFIGAEVLFFTAIGCGLFVGWYALFRPGEARRLVRPFATGLAVAGLVASVLLAYPLWMQFLGPQTYSGTGFAQRVHSEDLAAYIAYPSRSIAGDVDVSVRLAPNATEENSFFGPALIVLLTIFAAWFWRRVAVRAAVLTALVFVVLSLGPQPKIFGEFTGRLAPWAALEALPLFDAALPARFALMVVPIAGILLTLAWQRVVAEGAGAYRAVWSVAFAAALLPLVPLPLTTVPREPVPAFFTSGTWQRYVAPGRTLVPVPPASDQRPDGQRWQAATRNGFAIPDGFFLGPGGPDGRGRIGPIARPTSALLVRVFDTGVVPTITDADRRLARDDLRYWKADCVVLAPTRNHDALLATLTNLLGPPRRVDDVWVWPVRA